MHGSIRLMPVNIWVVTSNMPASINEAQKMEGNAEAQNLALQTAVDEEGLRLSGGLVV